MSVDDFSLTVGRAAAARSRDAASEIEARFRTLVQSPLRAGLLRFLALRAGEAHDVESLMATFGRMRLDVDNCLNELVDFGVVRRVPGAPAAYAFVPQERGPITALLDTFLERRAAISPEDQAPSVQRFREMIGRDEKMLVVFEWIRTAAKSDISVLIVGPTGSGKAVVAQMIHELSRRGQEKFQTVDCAALPDTLFGSDVFTSDAAAPAPRHAPKQLDLANHGTVLLNEIGELSLTAQANLLRVLENRQFERPGGQKPVQVDFRLISATNRPLDPLVREGRFREDLYYRVNAFAIRLPSLRERPVDIVVLANRFLARYCAANGLPLDAKTLSPEATAVLQAYPWPGNIRELESTITRAAMAAPGRVIRDTDVEFLQTHPVPRPDAPKPLPTLAEAERAHIMRVLEAVSWNKKEAARVLEISRGTLYRKIVEYQLDPSAGVSRNKTR